jgi:hypothetical protein
MRRLKNISAWRHEWFHQQFVIAGATHVGWTVYLFGKNRKKVRLFKDAFLVKSIETFRPIQSTRDIKSAQYFNKLLGTIVQRFMQWKYKTFFFQLIPASQAAFIPDLKAKTINSPLGIISF